MILFALVTSISDTAPLQLNSAIENSPTAGYSTALKELDRNGFVISTVQSDGCRYKTYDIDTELETMIDALSEVRDDGIDMITDAFPRES